MAELPTSRSEHLTIWHGTEVSALRTAPSAVLGDDRMAHLAETPHQFEIELQATDRARQLRTAARRNRPRPAQPTVFEIFWQEASGELRSLTRLEAPAAPDQVSEAWQEMRSDLPMEAGKVIFVARDPRPLGSSVPATAVAWQVPRIAQLGAPSNLKRTPDILLVTIDTLRADALDHAPGLAAILATGEQWTAAIAPSNWTLPSYASLFTGLDAPQHQAGRGPFRAAATQGPEDRQLSGVAPELPMLAEFFHDAGYATAMVHQNPMMETWTGFNRGFEQYVRASDRTEDALAFARAWWQANQDRPRFFVLHLMAPHLPYRVGPDPNPLDQLPVAQFFGEDHSPEQRRSFFDLEEADREIVRQRYFAEVSALDAELAPWLRELMESSGGLPLAIALHADHGEELWDEGSFEHGHSFIDAVVRVPLGIVYPGQLAARAYHDFVPAHGLAAELMDLAGIKHSFEHRLKPAPAEIISKMPLYRATDQGRQWTPQIAGRRLPFRPEQGSGGDGAWISADKQRMLIELGYLAERERRNSSKGD